MFDPELSLAVAVQAQPGVYALLVGSGLSSAAGIPTGWKVVAELVATIAVAANPGDEQAAERAREDPEGWWGQHGDGKPLGYSQLLEAVSAGSAAGRQAQLARFFEPSEDDLAAGRKRPTPAHQAIAELVRRRFIRVIVTTNFDRLLERALEDVGISPVVVSTPAAAVGAPPLQHSPCTIIKLHGDYVDLDQRNTVDELSSYPAEYDLWLDRIFAEYGLIISGWSAEWDIALVAALERASRRRYPLYWASYDPPGITARRLIAAHGAVQLDGMSADQLFVGLRDRVAALERMREAPLSTALKVDRMKQTLLDPTRRIQLFDLFVDEVDATTARMVTYPLSVPDESKSIELAEVDERLDLLAADTAPLLTVLTAGIYFDRDRVHLDLWSEVIRRLMAARRRPPNRFIPWWNRLQHYPALLCLRAGCLVAVLTQREDVLLRLLSDPTWRDPGRPSEPEQVAARVLSDWAVLPDGESLRLLPRWPGGGSRFPNSDLLRAALRPTFATLEPDDDAYRWLYDRTEYRIALHALIALGPGDVVWGRFTGEQAWMATRGAEPAAAVDFREHGDLATWASQLQIDGGVDGLLDHIASLSSLLRRAGWVR